jgi:hypothetical protein
MEKQLESVKNYLISILLIDFGAVRITENLNSWPELSWEAFIGELYRQNINLEICPKRDWENFFYTEKERFLTIKKEIFKLQNLTEIRQYLNLS